MEKHAKKFPFINDSDELLKTEFDRYNDVSLFNGWWFRGLLIFCVVAHFVATSIGLVSLSYGWKKWWAFGATSGEFVLVGLAIFFTYLCWRRDFHERWRQTRFAAEVLRGLKHSCKFLDPLYPLISQHHPAWHRFAISNSLQQSPCRDLNSKGDLAEYHRDRITDQASYFSAKLTPASFLGKGCKRMAQICSVLALIFLIITLGSKIPHLFHGQITSQPIEAVTAHQGQEQDGAQAAGKESVGGRQIQASDSQATLEHGKIDSIESVMPDSWKASLKTTGTKFLPTFLPLLAGLGISLTVVTDYGRRKERYAIMVRRLQELSSWFPTIRSPYATKRAVARCEEILLDELIEWYAFNKDIIH